MAWTIPSWPTPALPRRTGPVALPVYSRPARVPGITSDSAGKWAPPANVYEDWSAYPVYVEVTASATHWEPPFRGAAAVTAPHGKPRYDLGLDVIRGYLVAEGKRLEGKHRYRRST